jgi:MYXO-CTERM domain-containing protein
VAESGERTSAEGAERTPAEIEAEIERTREELGDTVAALAEKTDVKKQASEKAEQAKQSVRDNPAPLVGAAVAAAALVAFVVIRRRRR